MLALQNPPSAALTERETIPRWEAPVATFAELTEPRAREMIISSGTSSYRVVFSTSSLPSWVKPTILAFDGIRTLPSNWNSYGAEIINRDLIEQSLRVLSRIMQADSPTPSIVPLGDGGIQIEWHRKQQDLEIVFAADEAPQFYYRNQRAALEREGSANEFATLNQLLSALA